MARVDRGENPDTFAAERVMRAASTREEATTKGAALDAMREALLEKARTLYPDEVDAYDLDWSAVKVEEHLDQKEADASTHDEEEEEEML